VSVAPSLAGVDVLFRDATARDAAGVAEVYLASRKRFLPFAPLVHSDAEVHRWVADHLIPSGGVTVACRDGEVVGMMAISRDADAGWIDQLYLDPSSVAHGIGTGLVERAKRELGAPIRLYTFQANEGALRFYERHGFRPLAFGDGSGNEEGCPDVLCEWR
jgi:GNAT superfamily N-acetyltransferase